MTSIQTREQVPRVLAASRPRPAQGGPQPSFTARDMLRVVRKRKWLILIILAVFMVSAIVGTYIWAHYWPVYTTEALVVLRPPARTMLTQVWRAAGTADAIERYKRTNVTMVKNLRVLKEALALEDIRKTRWYARWTAGTAGDVTPAVKRLKEELKVVNVPDSEHIVIRMSMASNDGRDIQELPTIINGVGAAFRDFANEDAESQRNNEIASLVGEQERTLVSMRKLEDQIRSKLGRMAVPAMNRQLDTLAFELQNLTRRNAEVQDFQDDISAGRDALLEQQRLGALAANPMVLQALDADPILRQLQAQLKNSLAHKDVLASKYGPDHPNRKIFETSIESLRAEIEDYREQLSETIMESLINRFSQDWAANSRKLQANQDRLNEIMAKRRDLSQSIKEIENAEAEKDGLEVGLKKVESRLQELRLLRKDNPAILREALVPIDYDWPRYRVMVPLGIFLGTVVGLGLALLLEFMDTSVKTPSDITRRVDLPLLAMVPHADDMDLEVDDFRRAFLTGEVDSLLTESFRELRTNLLFSGPADKTRSLLITSPSPDDGRTSVAVNLAVAIANSGRKVLLVDANFRRPALQRVFGELDAVGLSDVLSAQRPWRDCVHSTDLPNLSVMASGKLPPNPNELLGSELAGKVLAEMCDQYDRVIFDGPPMLLIADAVVLATRVDSVVLVVRAGVNTHGIVTRCRQNLSRIGAHVLGVVLNGVRATAGGYLQKNYDAFYEYQEEDEDEDEDEQDAAEAKAADETIEA